MTLDDIKVSIRHDDECASIEGADGWEGTAPECNCSRREKIALLERLQEPTEEMLIAGSIAVCGKDQDMYRADARVVLEAMLKAAEEVQ